MSSNNNTNSTPFPTVNAALNVRLALVDDKFDKVSIGIWETREQEFRDNHMPSKSEDDDNSDSNSSDSNNEDEDKPKSSAKRKEIESLSELLLNDKMLKENIYDKIDKCYRVSQVSDYVYFPSGASLTITEWRKNAKEDDPAISDKKYPVDKLRFEEKHIQHLYKDVAKQSGTYKMIPAADVLMSSGWINWLRNNWTDKFVGSDISVELDKLCIFEAGDDGSTAVATERAEEKQGLLTNKGKKRIGTILFNLVDSSGSTKLVLDDKEYEFGQNAQAIFYDEDHRKHTISKAEDKRMILVFKVMVADKSFNLELERKKLKQEVTQTLCQLKKPVGILLPYKYIQSPVYNEADKILHDIVQSNPKMQLTAIPVVIRFNSYINDEDEVDAENWCNSSIYPLNEEIIERCKRPTNIDEDNDNNTNDSKSSFSFTRFFHANRYEHDLGCRWNIDTIDSDEGNQEEKDTYISYAFIVTENTSSSNNNNATKAPISNKKAKKNK